MSNSPFSFCNSSDLEHAFIVDEVRVPFKSLGNMSIVVVAQDSSRCGSPSKTVYGQPAGPSKSFIQMSGNLGRDPGIRIHLQQINEGLVDLRNQLIVL